MVTYGLARNSCPMTEAIGDTNKNLILPLLPVRKKAISKKKRVGVNKNKCDFLGPCSNIPPTEDPPQQYPPLRTSFIVDSLPGVFAVDKPTNYVVTNSSTVIENKENIPITEATMMHSTSPFSKDSSLFKDLFDSNDDYSIELTNLSNNFMTSEILTPSAKLSPNNNTNIITSAVAHSQQASVSESQDNKSYSPSTQYFSVQNGYWNTCAPLVWNQGFPTPLGGPSMSTNPVKAPDIRLSSSQFRKQHSRYKKAVSRTSMAKAIYAWPCESISREGADSPHSRPYQGIWGSMIDVSSLRLNANRKISQKGKCLEYVWQDPNPVLTLDGEQIELVEKFLYLGSCISAGGGVSDEIDTSIVKAKADYTNLGHLWCLRNVSLAVKVRIYNASVIAVLLYACETWPLRVEDIRRLSVFDHRCLRRIADIQWQHHVSNAEFVQGIKRKFSPKGTWVKPLMGCILKPISGNELQSDAKRPRKFVSTHSPTALTSAITVSSPIISSISLTDTNSSLGNPRFSSYTLNRSKSYSCNPVNTPSSLPIVRLRERQRNPLHEVVSSSNSSILKSTYSTESPSCSVTNSINKQKPLSNCEQRILKSYIDSINEIRRIPVNEDNFSELRKCFNL
ncbi:unnamed protein product [Schistosoma curassoni]|uniref:GATA-type domain-containing protein n=1 Tax=Schistosoma curassoni TaxID=6186 RepID=A0A183K7R9_9TREM|nr:unnamed protein product [Schistosoma curassoni]